MQFAGVKQSIFGAFHSEGSAVNSLLIHLQIHNTFKEMPAKIVTEHTLTAPNFKKLCTHSQHAV